MGSRKRLEKKKLTKLNLRETVVAFFYFLKFDFTCVYFEKSFCSNGLMLKMNVKQEIVIKVRVCSQATWFLSPR